MITGALRVDKGHFTTMMQPGVSSASLKPASTANLRPGSIITMAEANAGLLGVIESGTYGAMNFISLTAWAVFGGLTGNTDVFPSSMPALYASPRYLAEARGRIVLPVVANQPFEIVGEDAATGLEEFFG